MTQLHSWASVPEKGRLALARGPVRECLQTPHPYQPPAASNPALPQGNAETRGGVSSSQDAVCKGKEQTVDPQNHLDGSSENY